MCLGTFTHTHTHVRDYARSHLFFFYFLPITITGCFSKQFVHQHWWCTSVLSLFIFFLMEGKQRAVSCAYHSSSFFLSTIEPLYWHCFIVATSSFFFLYFFFFFLSFVRTSLLPSFLFLFFFLVSLAKSFSPPFFFQLILLFFFLCIFFFFSNRCARFFNANCDLEVIFHNNAILQRNQRGKETHCSRTHTDKHIVF